MLGNGMKGLGLLKSNKVWIIFRINSKFEFVLFSHRSFEDLQFAKVNSVHILHPLRHPTLNVVNILIFVHITHLFCNIKSFCSISLSKLSGQKICTWFLSLLLDSAKFGVLAMSSTCYLSYLPSIPKLINTSGILNSNFTENEELYKIVQDFVNQTIQGEQYCILFLGAEQYRPYCTSK